MTTQKNVPMLKAAIASGMLPIVAAAPAGMYPAATVGRK